MSLSPSTTAATTQPSCTSDGNQEEARGDASVSFDTNQAQLSDLFREEPHMDGETHTAAASECGNIQKCQSQEQIKLWRKRSARSKQILSHTCKGLDPYGRCRTSGIDFNVGSGRKRGLDLQRMTYGALHEIAKYSRQMSKAHLFFMEILESNFDICFHNGQPPLGLSLQIWNSLKLMMSMPNQNLRKVFELPSVVEKGTADCYPVMGLIGVENISMKPYPFCAEIGLNLYAVEKRGLKEKLSLSLLTNGVVTEMASFAEILAAYPWMIFHEILEHNFDLDLQGGKTEVAKQIQSAYLQVRNRIQNKDGRFRTKGMDKWDTPVRMKPQMRSRVTKSLSARQNEEGSRLIEVMKKRRLDMKIERDRRIEADGNFPLCREIGLKLNVKSESGAKEKLDLCLLTEDIVYEIHRFIIKFGNNYTSALYEIIDYNFDLRSTDHNCPEFASSLETKVKDLAKRWSKSRKKSTRVFELPFKSTETSANVFNEDSDSQTQNALDMDWLDWQRPIQDTDFCVTAQLDHYCWSMDTEPQLTSQIGIHNEQMNTCHASVKQEPIDDAEQFVPKPNIAVTLDSAKPFEEEILTSKRLEPYPDRTGYWGVKTTPIPEGQVDISSKNILDIAMNEGNKEKEGIFYRLANILSDTREMDKNFKQLIVDKYKAEILPMFIKEFRNLNPPQQVKVSAVNEFLCGLNLISGLAHQSKTTLDIWEKMISADSKVAVHMNKGIPELVSKTELLVRNVSDIAKNQFCKKDGKLVDIKCFSTDGEFKDIASTVTRENTIDGLFKDAAEVYSICSDIVEDGKDLNDHFFLGASAEELQHLKAGCRALGLVFKFIIEPLWNVLMSEQNLLEMEVRYQTLISKLIEWQEDGRDMVEGNTCLFDDVEVRKDDIFDRLTTITDSQFYELTVQIVEVMLASFVELCCKMLTSETNQDMRMNKNCRKYSSIVEHLQEAKLRDVSIAFESMFTFKEKRDWEWLQSLEQKQVSILKELHYSLMQQFTRQPLSYQN